MVKRFQVNVFLLITFTRRRQKMTTPILRWIIFGNYFWPFIFEDIISCKEGVALRKKTLQCNVSTGGNVVKHSNRFNQWKYRNDLSFWTKWKNPL